MASHKDSTGSTLLRKHKEPLDIGISKEERNNVLRAIEKYNSKDLETDGVDTAISFTWTMLQRAEDEWNALNKVEDEIDAALTHEVGDDAEEEDKGKGKRRKKVSSGAATLYSLKNKVERHRKNFLLLREFAKIIKDLGSLVEKREVIREKRMQAEWISIATHSAVLDAYVKCMLLAMMEANVPEPMRLEVVRRYQKLYVNYPIVTEDLQSIHDRLFGTPQEVANVQWEAIDSTPNYTQEEIRDQVSTALRKKR
jgi:hypothetical protein